MTSTDPNIKLELGDIINITAPSNTQLHNTEFLITYIDNALIKIINDNKVEEDLTIENHELTDTSIESITILYKPELKGYARQNDLVKDKWINIYFGGDIPTVLVGQITSLEEDMIEVKTLNNGIIYIDFAYKGLPPQYDITNIEIRDTPSIKKQLETIVEVDSLSRENVDGEASQSQALQTETQQTEAQQTEAQQTEAQQTEAQHDVNVIDTAENLLEEDQFEEPSVLETPAEDLARHIKEVLLDADKIQFGEDLGEVTEIVQVSEAEERFGIDTQVTDLLQELLHDIPIPKRTTRVINNLHRLIQRFKELRSSLSTFDTNNNVMKPDLKGDDYRPLIKTLQNLNKNLIWLIPVAQNIKKVYDLDITPDENSSYKDIDANDTSDVVIDLDNITNTYKNSSDESNRYQKYLKDVNNVMTPFISDDDNTLITFKEVNANITAVIDNFDNFTSNVVYGDHIKRKRFLIQKYNLGLSSNKQVEGFNKKPASVPYLATKSDTIGISSFLVLTHPIVTYSKIDLPTTSILARAELNMINVGYWELLKRKTNVNTELINENADDIQELQTLLGEITQISFNETENVSYEKLLELFVPRTDMFFKAMKKYIRQGYSLHQVLGYLEPFMVYLNDITYNQYSVFLKFINTSISKYITNYSTAEKRYQDYVNTNFKYTYIESTIILLLKDTIYASIFKSYNIDTTNTKFFTPEILKKCNNIDYSQLLTTSLSLYDDRLHNTIDITEAIKQVKTELSENISSPQDDTGPDPKCSYILAKQYKSLIELTEDNDKVIYFSPEFDNTEYKIRDKYRKQQTDMRPEDFISFLASQLAPKMGISREEAQYEAISVVNGLREVRNGNYAIVLIPKNETSEMSMLLPNPIFKRVGLTWEYDKEMSEHFTNASQGDLCNFQSMCLMYKEQCQPISNVKEAITDDYIDVLKKSWDLKLSTDYEALHTQLLNDYEYFARMIGRQKSLSKIIRFKNNDKYYDIGVTADIPEFSPSPHVELRDRILGGYDFIKKQIDIIDFCNKYTRSSNENEQENKYWLYCVDSNKQLLPVFYKTLAVAFIQDKNNYEFILNKLIATQGTLEDGSDTIVDKYSGFEITKIAPSDADDFTSEGYRIISTSVLPADIQDLGLPVENDESNIMYKGDALVVKRIIDTLTKFMNIELPSSYNFIIRNAIQFTHKKIGNEEMHNKRKAAFAKKGKNYPTYEFILNKMLLFSAVSFLIVAIQTVIPSINTKKVFPNCIKSFVGYPLQGNTDNSSLTYVACIMDKIKSKISPWDILIKICKEKTDDKSKESNDDSKKNNTQKIVDNIRKIMDEILEENKEVVGMIGTKLNYLSTHENIVVTYGENDLNKWFSFLPPLYPFKQDRQHNVTSEFYKALERHIKENSRKQFDDLDILMSKIVYFSLNIQEDIQKAISKSTPLLKLRRDGDIDGSFFLENVCCNDGVRGVIQYFNEKEPGIMKNNNLIYDLSEEYFYFKYLVRPTIFFDPYNTKLKYPAIMNTIDEQTIYLSFIHYCKYNKGIPLTGELSRVCVNNTSNFNKLDTLDSKIKIMKDEGKIYGEQNLQELLQIVGLENKIDLTMVNEIPNELDNLKMLLRKDTFEDYKLDPKFLEHMKSVVEGYGDKSKRYDLTRELRNYLMEENKNRRLFIKDFINRNANIRQNKFNLISKYLDTLENYTLDSDSIQDNNSDLTFKIVTSLRNTIFYMSRILPDIVLNKVNPMSSIDVKRQSLKYLSGLHIKDIESIINYEYLPWKQFYNKLPFSSDSSFLNSIKEVTLDIQLFSNHTPFIKVSDDNDQPVFNGKLLRELYTYYLLEVIKKYIDLQGLREIEMRQTSSMVEQDEDNQFVEDIEAEEGNASIENNELFDINKKIATFLTITLEYLSNTKKTTNILYDTIMSKVRKAKEKEIEDITDNFKLLNDDERNVEFLLKVNKLGRWSKGLSKGVTEYVMSEYDEDRAAMEERVLKEQALGQFGIVTEMNRDIYTLDLDQQRLYDQESFLEANDISGLADDEGDNYDNDNDGDERY